MLFVQLIDGAIDIVHTVPEKNPKVIAKMSLSNVLFLSHLTQHCLDGNMSHDWKRQNNINECCQIHWHFKKVTFTFCMCYGISP